jgi:hypothetical protein
MTQKLCFSGKICIFLSLFYIGIFGQTQTTETKDFDEIRTNQKSIIGRPIQTFGVIELTDGYFAEFKKAQKTHYAFILRKYPNELNSFFVYMKRGGKGDELQAKLLSMEKYAKLDGAFTIFVEYATEYSGVNAELLDFTLGAKKPEPPKPTPKNPSGTVTVSYDKFKDKTTITGVAHLLDCQDRSDTALLHADFGAAISFTGKKPTTTPTVELKFRLFNNDLGANPEFVFFADDKRLALGKGNSDTKQYRVISQIISVSVTTISIPLDSFKLIANSKKVEAKVGERELAPPFIELDAIQKILPVFREMLRDLENQ